MITVCEITPDNPLQEEEILKSQKWDKVHRIFLAGTIDNGESEDWQTKYLCTIIDRANHVNDLPFVDNSKELWMVFNPRRKNWNANDSSDSSAMNIQVNWELDHLEIANSIIMNILPNSKSPISLMEMGLFAKTEKMVVYCPEDFYRFHNVRILCERYNIELHTKNI